MPNGECRMPIGARGDCHFAASEFNVSRSALLRAACSPAEAREASESWWAVQDSNL